MNKQIIYPRGYDKLIDLIEAIHTELSLARGFELPILAILLRLHPVRRGDFETNTSLSEICGLSRTSIPRLVKAMEALDLITIVTIPRDRFVLQPESGGRSLLDRVLATLES